MAKSIEDFRQCLDEEVDRLKAESRRNDISALQVHYAAYQCQEAVRIRKQFQLMFPKKEKKDGKAKAPKA